MPGAAALAATSALRAGAGKIAVATVAAIAPGIALRLAEARVIAMAETEAGGIAADAMAKVEAQLAKVDAVLIGPGLQDAAATRAFTRRVLKRATRAAIVVDALAMDAVLDLRRFERTPLLTPHAGEMAHLTGATKEAVSADPERHAREAALALERRRRPQGRDDVHRHARRRLLAPCRQPARPRHVGVGRRPRRHHRRPGGTRRPAGAGGGLGHRPACARRTRARRAARPDRLSRPRAAGGDSRSCLDKLAH